MWCHLPLALPVLGPVRFPRRPRRPLLCRGNAGRGGMAGGLPYVVEPLAPEGVVRYGGELWHAAGDERLEKGARVRIERVEGMTVVVRREPAVRGTGRAVP